MTNLVGGKIQKSRGSTEFVINSLVDPNVKFPISAIILNKVTDPLPAISDIGLPEFDHLDLADRHYYKGGK